jgi:tripartite-type tricarboxylate transporter receptor subunit TctC
MKLRRHALKTLSMLGAGALLALSGSQALAQAFPTKPVRITTPFPAGSGPDAAMRVLGEHLGRKWGQAVVIDNKPGGNGFVAMAAFKQGPADGYNLVMLDSNHTTTHPHTFSKLPYDVQKDLQPVGMILRTPFFMAVAADSPHKTAADIVAAAKAKPDAVTYGSWFLGSPGHIGALRLQVLKDISMTHIPYKDFGMLYTAVATKEVDWALGSAASAGPLERSGKIKFLALAAAQRDPLYPDVPATAELPGLKGFEVSAWAGVFAPRGTPAAVRDRIAADIAQALTKPDVVERYRKFGYEAPKLTPAAFGRLMQAETKTWGEVIKASNLKLD